MGRGLMGDGVIDNRRLRLSLSRLATRGPSRWKFSIGRFGILIPIPF